MENNQTSDQIDNKTENKVEQQLDMFNKQTFEMSKLQDQLNNTIKTNKELQAQLDKHTKEKEDAEKQNLEKKGEFDKLAEKIKSDHQKELQKAIEKQNELFTKYSDTKICNLLQSSLTKANVNPKAINDITTLLKVNVSLGEDMETLVIKDHKDIDELVLNYLKEKDFLIINATPGGSGSPKVTTTNVTSDNSINGYLSSIYQRKN